MGKQFICRENILAILGKQGITRVLIGRFPSHYSDDREYNKELFLFSRVLAACVLVSIHAPAK